MSYLHCHGPNGDRSGCHWSQDDFWTETYNPGTKITEDYNNFIKDPERKIYFDMNWIQEAGIKWGKDETGYFVMAKDLFIWELEKEILNVKNMKVYTYEQWDKVIKDWKCPKCGSKHWDID
jgi:hypothetical protein